MSLQLATTGTKRQHSHSNADLNHRWRRHKPHDFAFPLPIFFGLVLENKTAYRAIPVLCVFLSQKDISKILLNLVECGVMLCSYEVFQK